MNGTASVLWIWRLLDVELGDTVVTVYSAFPLATGSNILSQVASGLMSRL